MALKTYIAVQTADESTAPGPVNLLASAILALCRAEGPIAHHPDPDKRAASALLYTERDDDGVSVWGTEIGQGLPGAVDIRYRAGGLPVAAEDEYEDPEDAADPDHLRIVTPAHHVMLFWDTAYSHRHNGLGCSGLHAAALVYLDGMLRAEGLTMKWCNEYTGEWFSGLDRAGLEEFVRVDRNNAFQTLIDRGLLSA